MATLRCLELLWKWLPLGTSSNHSNSGNSGNSGNHGNHGNHGKHGGTTASSSSPPLFDLDTIVRRLLRILPDIALREASMPKQERYAVPLLHLGKELNKEGKEGRREETLAALTV